MVYGFHVSIDTTKTRFFEDITGILSGILEERYMRVNPIIGEKISKYTTDVQLHIDRKWSIRRYAEAITLHFSGDLNPDDIDYFSDIIKDFIWTIRPTDVDEELWAAYYAKYRRAPAEENIADYYWWNNLQ